MRATAASIRSRSVAASAPGAGVTSSWSRLANPAIVGSGLRMSCEAGWWKASSCSLARDGFSVRAATRCSNLAVRSCTASSARLRSMACRMARQSVSPSALPLDRVRPHAVPERLQGQAAGVVPGQESGS
jgi:hypothetical protein